MHVSPLRCLMALASDRKSHHFDHQRGMWPIVLLRKGTRIEWMNDGIMARDVKGRGKGKDKHGACMIDKIWHLVCTVRDEREQCWPAMFVRLDPRRCVKKTGLEGSWRIWEQRGRTMAWDGDGGETRHGHLCTQYTASASPFAGEGGASRPLAWASRELRSCRGASGWMHYWNFCAP